MCRVQNYNNDRCSVGNGGNYDVAFQFSPVCPESFEPVCDGPSECSNGQVCSSNTCETCPANKYTSDGTDCSFCPAGKKSTAGSQSCSDCPLGRYQGENTPPPSATCKVHTPSCPAGRKTSEVPTATNNRVCTDCSVGKYQTSSDFEGTTCVSLSCQFFSQPFCFSFSLFSLAVLLNFSDQS